MTHLKISQKTWQAAAAQPVRPSLAVHVVCSSSLISYLNLPSFPPLLLGLRMLILLLFSLHFFHTLTLKKQIKLSLRRGFCLFFSVYPSVYLHALAFVSALSKYVWFVCPATACRAEGAGQGITKLLV